MLMLMLMLINVNSNLTSRRKSQLVASGQRVQRPVHVLSVLGLTDPDAVGEVPKFSQGGDDASIVKGYDIAPRFAILLNLLVCHQLHHSPMTLKIF